MEFFHLENYLLISDVKEGDSLHDKEVDPRIDYRTILEEKVVSN